MASLCPKCGKSVPAGAAQCTHCEAVLPSEILSGPTSRPGVGGRWEVLEALGALGTQKVYRVRNRTTEDEAALRMLPLAMGSEETAQDRIRNLISRGKDLIGEPGIIAVVGFEVEDRTPYFITQIFPGVSLLDRLKKDRTLPAEEVRRIGLGIAVGLESAHNRSFFHGELRPVCVVLGEDEEVRTTDFGVGKIVTEAAARAMGGGMAGGPAKVPFYKAPEFVKSDLPDARADLYSLGCILFECLTGDRRFPDSYRDALAEPKPGTPFPDPCAGYPKMDPALREVVRKLLAPAPGDRFEDAEAAGLALKGEPFKKVEVLSAGVIPPPPPGAPRPAGMAPPPPPPPGGGRPAAAGKPGVREDGEPRKPLPVGLILVGLVVASLLGAVGWMVWQGSLFDSFRAPSDDEEAETIAPPPPPPDAPPALPGLPAPPVLAAAGLRLPARVVERAGRLYSHADGAELVAVPGGDFVFGCAEGGEDERPVRRIQLAPFLIDRHEVTVGQFRRFAQATGRRLPPQPAGSSESHPVVNVTWIEASAFAHWAGRRLPTEAEWERAARGTEGNLYPWGTADEESRRNGPGAGDGQMGMAVAGSFPSGMSPAGGLDFAGNAWEWCGDWYGAGYYLTGPPKDPRGPSSGTERVVRGGSFLLGAGALRASFRNHFDPAASFEDIGFRCAADLK